MIMLTTTTSRYGFIARFIQLWMLGCAVLGAQLHAQSGCASCGSLTEVDFYLNGHGFITVGNFSQQVDSTSPIPFRKVGIYVPASGELHWSSQASGGGPGSGDGVFWTLNGKILCSPIFSGNGASWCRDEYNPFPCCDDPVWCPDSCDYLLFDCSNDLQGPDTGYDSGEIRVIDSSDPSFNPGSPGQPSLGNSSQGQGGDWTKKQPDYLYNKISLGRGTSGLLAGKPYGHIIMKLPLNGSSVSRSAFNLSPDAGAEVYFEPGDLSIAPEYYSELMDNNLPTQVLTPECLAILEEVKDGQNMPVGFRIKTYHPEDCQFDNVNLVYVPNGLAQPISEVEVSKKSYDVPGVAEGDTDDFVQTTTRRTDGSVEVSAVFSKPDTNPSVGNITEVTANRATQTVYNNWDTNNPDYRLGTVTEFLKDPVSGAFVPVKETTNTYRKFVRTNPAGTFEKIVESTTGSGAQARTTYSFYEEDPQSLAFGKLIAQYNPDGSWVRHEYGSALNYENEIEPIKTYTPWLDEAGLNLPANATRSQILSAIQAVPAAQCRVEEVQYLDDPDRTIRKITVAGVLVSTETETRIVVIDPFTGDRVLEKQRVLRDGSGSRSAGGMGNGALHRSGRWHASDL
jgi:hypothetical protein